MSDLTELWAEVIDVVRAADAIRFLQLRHEIEARIRADERARVSQALAWEDVPDDTLDARRLPIAANWLDLASPEAEQRLAAGLRQSGARANGVEAYDDTARAILAALREQPATDEADQTGGTDG